MREEVAAVRPALTARGLKVVAPAVPNRSLLGDSAHIASVVRQIPGPVVLVGHSYGGAVITVAGAEDNVEALVYLAGYALEEGESPGELQGGFPDSDLAAALVHTPFPIEGSPARSRSGAVRDPSRLVTPAYGSCQRAARSGHGGASLEASLLTAALFQEFVMADPAFLVTMIAGIALVALVAKGVAKL
ncbi:alpha/beta fold hydrolase [Streptomyces sp. NPDC002640]